MAERVLITGGLGFIGTATTAELLRRGHEVVLTRHRRSDPAKALHDQANGWLTVVDLDLAQPLAVLDTIAASSPDAVVHLSTAGWRGSLAGEVSTNVNGLVHVLEACLRSHVHRIVTASSIAVYAGVTETPYREDQPLPVSAVADLPAVTKRVEELLALQCAARSELDVRIARIPIVYGPGYRSGLNVPSVLVEALVAGAAVPDSLPMPFDDLCYIDDIAAGLTALTFADGLSSQIFNLSSGESTGCEQIAEVAGQHGADESTIAAIIAGGTARADRIMDPQRTRDELGWYSQTSFEAGFERYMSWRQQR
jgi:UDP-glucose 4-epimerase